MWILDEAIKNRTENWKTARHFVPLLWNGDARAALVQRLGEPGGTTGSHVKLELFWKGVRDYRAMTGEKRNTLVPKCEKAYKKQFGKLRADIREFIRKSGYEGNRGSFRKLDSLNYNVSEPEKLYNNLENTEIDIVLETPNSLFIGEAKGEMGLGTGGKNVLVHQLVRQYVTARILLDVMGKEKEVIPFLVVPNADEARKTGQVRFMMKHEEEWLKEKNVLTWCDIRALQPRTL